MFRYYMTPETRRAVIAESNRLIAERAALNASRKQLDAAHAEAPSHDDPASAQADAGLADFSDSAFARLVSDLQLTALRMTSGTGAIDARR